ncbi:MAG: hypothetical protein DI551_00255 [Micavibrio aeruginosavorus]|uniref:Uncharacterized protein n=1 Tax=Micavibrio aeruginosavorus TaxID=349221 RepID=A0A2W5PWB0_9BACT|nr:MAG: hypothetical protein DI551_00255 [Micavibrio aeruginosavorus]
MTPRTSFILQLLQKLGAPLMGAVNAHAAADSAGEKEAQAMAQLLSESVKVGISLSQAMNLKTDDGDADAIRVALATLAGGLVAESYKQTGRVPGDAEGRRILKALESVIVFSDNFAPAAEHAQRLQTLEGAPPFFDPVQTSIYTLHALLPAIGAISEFSFGQSETRLVQEVSERLGAKAKELSQTLGGGANAMSEMIILQALGQVYADVHKAETKNLKAKGDEATASMEAVWASFARQVTMLEVVMGSMGASGTGSGSGGGAKPAVNQPAAVEAPVAPTPPAAPPASTAPASAPPAGGNPMSFFKKK